MVRSESCNGKAKIVIVLPGRASRAIYKTFPSLLERYDSRFWPRSLHWLMTFRDIEVHLAQWLQVQGTYTFEINQAFHWWCTATSSFWWQMNSVKKIHFHKTYYCYLSVSLRTIDIHDVHLMSMCHKPSDLILKKVFCSRFKMN